MQQFRETDLVVRKVRMQFGRAGVVRIAPGDDAATARAATAGRQISIVETHALRGQIIDARGFDDLVAVASQILLRDIVSNEEDKIRAFLLSEQKS